MFAMTTPEQSGLSRSEGSGVLESEVGQDKVEKGSQRLKLVVIDGQTVRDRAKIVPARHVFPNAVPDEKWLADQPDWD